MPFARLKKEIMFVVVLLLVTSVAHTQDQDIYQLDNVSRDVSPTGALTCPEIPLINYSGVRIRYTRPARVHPDFAERLEMFEHVVAETAMSVFGREPTFIVQKGSYYCRRVRSIPSLISEHSLGNAVDVYAFKFGPLKKSQTLPDGLPQKYRRAFNVNLLKHWDETSNNGSWRAIFLRKLAQNLTARPDIFRVMLGPAYPGHKNHFHFDCASYRLVSI